MLLKYKIVDKIKFSFKILFCIFCFSTRTLIAKHNFTHTLVYTYKQFQWQWFKNALAVNGLQAGGFVGALYK